MTLKSKFNVGDRVWAYREGWQAFFEYKVVSIPEWFEGSGFNYLLRHEDNEETFEEITNEDSIYQYREDVIDAAFRPYVEQEEPQPVEE